MLKALLIAEKPDLMRKIKEVYDKHKNEVPYEIDFESQRGHLLTLKTPDKLDPSLKSYSWDTLPINPEDYGGFQYEVIKEKKQGNFMTSQERFDQIKEKIYSGKYDYVINAGDPDQEGELLIRIVLSQMNNKLPILRFWTNDLTDAHILKALQTMKDDEKDPMLVRLLDAAYCRQHSDYRVGMNVSRAASMKANGRVAAGRVKTPTLGMVVKRELEIKEFKPKTVYGVKAVYDEGFEGTLFAAANMQTTDEEEEETDRSAGTIWFETKKEADDLIATLDKTAKVIEYTAKREQSYAPKLFKLATAQREAGKLGYNAADTQRIIQGLYEKKIMSYPRTGCEYIHSDENFKAMLRSASNVPELAPFVAGITDEDIARVKKTERWVNDKVANDEGHTALVPTTEAPNWNSLDKEEKDIYTLIVRQFVAIFLPTLIQDKATLITDVKGNTFRSSGKTLVDPGYTKIFNRSFSDMMIPVHQKGDNISVNSFKNTEKTSTCPKRYTSPELIAAMENPAKFLEDESLKKLGKRLKIGTPATRSGIIEELVRNGYLVIKKEGKREVLVPTDTGITIIKNLSGTAICKVDMTGEWEEQLEAVRRGELTKDDFEMQMRENVRALVEEIKGMEMKSIDNGHASQYTELGTCPKCGKKIMRGPSRFYCTGYKEGCKVGGFIKRYESTIENDEFMDMLMNGTSITKSMTYKGITWNQEVKVDAEGKLTYPSSAKATEFKCPKCGKTIIETATGYSCEGRKDKSCDVYVGKSIGGKLIPSEQFAKLFTTGKTDVIAGFYSEKKKKSYDAALEYSASDGKIVMRLGFAEKATSYRCPVCDRPMVKVGAQLMCTGKDDNSCHFRMFATAYKKDLPKETIEKMLEKVAKNEIKGGETAFITDAEVDTDMECPFCGGKIKRNGSHFYCENVPGKTCGFELYRLSAGHILDDHEVLALVSAGKTPDISDFVKKDGSHFSARLELNWDTKKVEMKFIEGAKEESPYTCPCCKEHKLMKNGYKLTCECGFSAWTIASKKPITKKNLNLLFTKGETEVIKMKSKTGKPFEAKIAIDYDNKSTKFVFPKR